MTEDFIHHLGYVGIVLVLVLGGLGLPVPEEAPIILAAVLSKKQTMWWPLALASCMTGVLVGDFVVYFLGFVYGEKVLGFRVTRKFLTRAREAQIKGYFHRHGFKILILGRFAVGFRTAAYLTAGILRLPALKLLVTDLFAASLSTLLMFGLGWRFAEWIEAGMKEAKHWIFAILTLSLLAILLYRFYAARKRAGMLVGPPVYLGEDAGLPPDAVRTAQRARESKPAAADAELREEPQPEPSWAQERTGDSAAKPPLHEAAPDSAAEPPVEPPPRESVSGDSARGRDARASSANDREQPSADVSQPGAMQARPPAHSERKS